MNISPELKDSILKERTLKEQLENVESQITILNESIEEGKSKYGWKDSYLNGFLGGNRPLVKSVDKMYDELDSFEKKVKQLRPRLKKIEKSVKSELIKVVSPMDDNLESYLKEKERWLKLERKSKSYKNLVIKAEQGIKDALVFLSWDKLLNHPDAKSKLNEFKKETLEYQRIISGLTEEITTIKGEIVVFEDLIKFSSQQVAMNSFRILATNSNEYYKLAYDQVEDYLEKTRTLLDEVKSKVI